MKQNLYSQGNLNILFITNFFFCNHGFFSSVTNSKHWNPNKCPSLGKWINQLWFIHTMKHKESSADTPDSVRELRVRQPKSKKPFSKATDGVTVSPV